MSLTLSDWLYEGMLMDGGLLAIDPVYFSIKGGRERWLYRVARKHAGGAGEEGFAIPLPTLFEKSGAEGTYRRFKFEMKLICETDPLPEFHLSWIGRNRRTLNPHGTTFGTLFRITPAYCFPAFRNKQVPKRS